MMRCYRCDQAEPLSVHRAKLVERGRQVAVVRDVPMEECPACGERMMTLDIADQLDQMLRRLLDSDAAVAVARWPAGSGQRE